MTKIATKADTMSDMQVASQLFPHGILAISVSIVFALLGYTPSLAAMPAATSLGADVSAGTQAPAAQSRGSDSAAAHPPVVGGQTETALPLATDLSPAIKKRAVRRAMRKVADWELARVQGRYTTDWTMAALYAGFMAASDATRDRKYRRAMKEMGESLHWQLGPRVTHADDAAIAQTYLELYFRYHRPVMIAAVRERFDAAVKNSASTGATSSPDATSSADAVAPSGPTSAQPLWWWCDALFMAPPGFARLYRVTGDRAYLGYLTRQWWATSKLLYDPVEHLYSRDASYLNKTEANGRKVFWSRGNGWVMAGLARVLDEMPEDYLQRGKFLTQYKQMAATVVGLQGQDGLWRPGLLDADAYPLPETSGSAFFTYALAWGVNNEVLDPRTYKPAVTKAWKGLIAHIYSDGRLGCIQPIGAAPGQYSETASYTFGVGAFLLAGSEVAKMAAHKHEKLWEK